MSLIFGLKLFEAHSLALTAGNFDKNVELILDEKVLKRVERSDLTNSNDTVVIVTLITFIITITIIVVNSNLVIYRKD